MIRAMLAWAGIVALGLVSVALTMVAYGAGIPKPPNLTTEGLGRVSWGPVIDNLDLTLQGTRSVSFAGWHPTKGGILVRASHLVLDRRLHSVTGPGEAPRLVWGVPRNVSTIAGADDRAHMILGWDVDGREQFQLYRWDLGDEAPVRLTNGTERAAFGAFDPRGPRFAFTSNRRNGTDFDVYVGDAHRPGTEQLVRRSTGTWDVADWSPDGGALLLKSVSSNVEARLHLFDLESGETAVLGPRESGTIGYGQARFTRDGSGVYLVSDRDTEFRLLRKLVLGTGEETLLTGDLAWDVESFRESGDGSFLTLDVNEDGRNRTYLYHTKSERLEALDLFPSGLTAMDLHPTKPLLAVNHVDPRGVSRVYLYDVSNQELTLWAGTEPAPMEVSAPQLIHYPTFDEVDGQPRLISAFAYPGFGEGPRPVLIDIHGGPEAQARVSYGHVRRQRAGMTVITPNVRGSTGYGKSFTKLDDGYLRENAVRDIGALLDWIQTQSTLDPTRVGVTGGSYGGYMSLASLVHYSDRIRCGVDVVGVSNFVTFLENTAPYRRDLRRAEYGDERDPDMRRFLESISPLNNAHRIMSPLMVVQGANDPRVPVGESRQIVERVRDNDQAVAYIEAADEGHGFRKPWNSLYAGTAQLQMMTACLND
ncbi:MAG: prolyl oligopeptidase family serine peptidase [Gemmatimonadota bacterium]|nr:prolyl oligopeptidase family serine peptidase [Gemmatimonadota bacterium]